MRSFAAMALVVLVTSAAASAAPIKATPKSQSSAAVASGSWLGVYVSGDRPLITAVSIPPRSAAAEPAGARSSERSGFLLGVSAGAGVLVSSCSECETVGGAGFQLHLGWMLTSRLALLYGGSGIAKGDVFASESNLVMGPSIRLWTSPRVWLESGAGLGQRETHMELPREDETRKGLGVWAATGYEFHRTGPLVFDAQARVSTSFYADERVTNATVQLGANWQ